MNAKPSYKEYPRPVSRRTGMKVSWYRYSTREEAEKCGEAARHNARIQEGLGYDFGFLTPGDIVPVSEGFEVVIP